MTEAYVSFGSSSNLWGMSWTDADINATTFGVVIATVWTDGVDTAISHYLKATNFGFTIPSGATINGIVAEFERKQAPTGGGTITAYIDHIRMTVYYTDATTSTSTSSSISTSTTTSVSVTTSTSSSLSTSSTSTSVSTSLSTSISTSSTSQSTSSTSNSTSTSSTSGIITNLQPHATIGVSR